MSKKSKIPINNDLEIYLEMLRQKKNTTSTTGKVTVAFISLLMLSLGIFNFRIGNGLFGLAFLSLGIFFGLLWSIVMFI